MPRHRRRPAPPDPKSPSPNWSAAQVAAWLGYANAEQFLRARPRLEAEHGFPAPLPGLGKLQWSAVSLAAWQLALLPARLRATLAPNGEATPGNWDGILEARLKGEAA